MAFQFEKLLVFQKAVDLADAVCSIAEQFSRGYGFLVDQLNRAALSISSDIAEGNGRFTKSTRLCVALNPQSAQLLSVTNLLGCSPCE